MKYDIIGDIHGYALELVRLLEKLGYAKENGFYEHPESDRKAIFVGDFIDRGPKIRETLLIVKAMVDNGSAYAVLGNHEYNALCYHTEKEGESNAWLRPRTCKNIKQHIKTLQQFKKYPKKEWEKYLAWFYTLPLFLELDGIRIIHAAWLPDEIEKIRRWTNGSLKLSKSFLQESAIKDSDKYNAIETLLKGVEIKLPAGVDRFKDKDGNLRNEIRVKWWESAKGKTYEDMLFPKDDSQNMGRKQIEPSDDMLPVYKDPVPIFFGHYWLDPCNMEKPQVQAKQICCLDYSVAKKGLLVAYRWEGENELKNKRFNWIR